MNSPNPTPPAARDADRLVAALKSAGWVEEGRPAGSRARFRFGSLSPSLVVPLDREAPEYSAVFDSALRTLERFAELGDAARCALEEATCSCGGKRWVDDQNWQPELWEAQRGRIPASGLIPCGFCNEGGWDTPCAIDSEFKDMGDGTLRCSPDCDDCAEVS